MEKPGILLLSALFGFFAGINSVGGAAGMNIAFQMKDRFIPKP